MLMATAEKLKDWIGLPTYRDAIKDQFWQRVSGAFSMLYTIVTTVLISNV